MEEAEPSNAASASKKRKADDGATVTVAPLKKVTFAGDAKASKMFTPAEQESLDASIGQNKAIAKKAKKQKRKQAKVAANAMDADEEPAEVDEVEQLSLGLEARTKALQVSQAEPADDEGVSLVLVFGSYAHRLSSLRFWCFLWFERQATIGPSSLDEASLDPFTILFSQLYHVPSAASTAIPCIPLESGIDALSSFASTFASTLSTLIVLSTLAFFALFGSSSPNVSEVRM